MTDINRLMRYEDGELTAYQTLELFSDLIRTGKAWTLQGSYGRQAQQLIDTGYISKYGDILTQL